MTCALGKSLEITNMHVRGVGWSLSDHGGVFTQRASLSVFLPSTKQDEFTHCANARGNTLRVPATDEAIRPGQTPAYALAVGTIEWPQLDLGVTFLDDPCC